MGTLEERLLKFEKERQAEASEDKTRVLERSVEDLRNSDILEGTLTPGDRAPSFSLANGDGGTVSLGSLLEPGPVALHFYRGIW